MTKQNAALGIVTGNWEELNEQNLMNLSDTEFYLETRKQWGKVRTVTLAVYMQAGKILRCLQEKCDNFTKYIRDELDISKSQAYNYMNAIKCYEELVETFKNIDVKKAISNLSLSAFLTLRKVHNIVKELVLQDLLSPGEYPRGISKSQIEQYQNEYYASQSNLIPQELKEVIETHAVKPKIGKLVEHMEQMDPGEIESIQVALNQAKYSPDLHKEVKEITQSAKDVKGITDFLYVVNNTYEETPQDSTENEDNNAQKVKPFINTKNLTDESLRLNITGAIASAVRAQEKMVDLFRKALEARKTLQQRYDILFTETGASNPETQKLASILEEYTRNVFDIPGIKGESGARIQIYEDNLFIS